MQHVYAKGLNQNVSRKYENILMFVKPRNESTCNKQRRMPDFIASTLYTFT